jgi:hypothetical protein
MLWDIDLIFGIWVYNDDLQIKFTLRSSPMIFGQHTAVGLWNLTKYLVVTILFAMLGDVDLIFGIWGYNDELQFKFTLRSSPMIFGQLTAVGLWNLAKYLVVTTFFPLCLEILTWFLVYKCIMIRVYMYNHKLQINVEICSGWMIFGQLTAVGLCNLAKYLVVTTSLTWLLTWSLVYEYIIMRVYNHKLQINFEIWPNI